ncbi:MAG: metallophosphoesterase family protein [Sphaerochaeta sp.]|nr:metallophosphoesterase family protein [Sphaerochaeta sp.]
MIRRFIPRMEEGGVLDGTVLITADLHGSVDALRAVVERSRIEEASHLIIAGDLCPGDDPNFKVLLSQAPPLTVVRGNCDSSYAFSRSQITYPPRLLQRRWQDRTIMVTHGDLFFEPAHYGLGRGDILITGHTHVPLLEIDASGVLQINGGSPALTRSRWGKTYALLRSHKASIHRVGDGSCCFSLALIDR